MSVIVPELHPVPAQIVDALHQRLPGVDDVLFAEIADTFASGDGDLASLLALAARDLAEQGVSVVDLYRATQAA